MNWNNYIQILKVKNCKIGEVFYIWDKKKKKKDKKKLYT